ncbi:MAG TPA: hypothetical protein VE243_04150 [Candidatus Acidoferrum sp.]|nr:hypothetical protein [Candidatus Acidoferrum sp.]
MRDGSICIEQSTDLVGNGFNALQHFDVPKSNYSEASRLQLLSPDVVILLARVAVLFSVEFYDQSRFDAAEICDVRINRDLSAKFEAIELSILHDRPEPLLGFGGIAT